MKAHILSLIIFCILPFVANAEKLQPHEIIEHTSEQVLSVLQQEEAEIRQNPNRINELVDEIILPICDVERMGKYILAKHWKTATTDQKDNFLQEFQQMLIRTYGKHIVEFTNAKITVLPEKSSQEKIYQTVNTVLDTRNGIKPLQMDYVFRVDEDSSKIVDVRVEGMSILKTFRTAFTKEIAETSLDQLITRITLSNQPSLALNATN